MRLFVAAAQRVAGRDGLPHCLRAALAMQEIRHAVIERGV
jgi:hypothetical protein